MRIVRVRILRFMAIPLALSSAGICLAADTSTPAPPPITINIRPMQKCPLFAKGQSAACVAVLSPKEDALTALKKLESRPETRTCYVLRSYRFSTQSGNFNPQQTPQISDCHPAATFEAEPAQIK